MSNELSIKVNIADRYYPLRVTPEEEEIVRQASRLINEKLKSFQQQFGVRDKQDMLCMTVLELATQLITRDKNTATEGEGLGLNLKEIQELLNDISI